MAGKKEKASRGGFAGGASPLGYRRDREGGLEIQPAEAEIVRRIYAMRDDMTLQEIAGALNLEDVPTKRGGKWYLPRSGMSSTTSSTRGRLNTTSAGKARLR